LFQRKDSEGGLAVRERKGVEKVPAPALVVVAEEAADVHLDDEGVGENPGRAGEEGLID
jgi:hypothetical protein